MRAYDLITNSKLRAIHNGLRLPDRLLLRNNTDNNNKDND